MAICLPVMEDQKGAYDRIQLHNWQEITETASMTTCLLD